MSQLTAIIDCRCRCSGERLANGDSMFEACCSARFVSKVGSSREALNLRQLCISTRKFALKPGIVRGLFRQAIKVFERLAYDKLACLRGSCQVFDGVVK